MKAKTSPICTFSKGEKVNRTLKIGGIKKKKKTKNSKVVVIY